MNSHTNSPELLHAHMLQNYGSEDSLELAVVEAGGQWLIGVDASVKPPKLTLDNIDTCTGFILDSDTITIRSEDDSYIFFNNEETEQRALQLLSKLFGY